MTGKEYADLVASYILANFGSRGLVVYREVQMGKTIIGKNRHGATGTVETHFEGRFTRFENLSHRSDAPTGGYRE